MDLEAIPDPEKKVDTTPMIILLRDSHQHFSAYHFSWLHSPSVVAIALATASPAYAASVAGVIAFVDAEDLIGSGYTANLVVQLTPPQGEPLPDGVSVGYRGSIVDSWNGGWLYRSLLASNTFTPAGTLFGGDFDDPGTVSGGIAWRLSVRTTGEDRLAWQQRSGFPFSGRPIGGTYQEGTTRAGSGIGMMNVVPAIRTKLSSTSNPGGTAFFEWSFPRFPRYSAVWSIAY
jgi:hypothetical protein